jgi:hypothetical protein
MYPGRSLKSRNSVWRTGAQTGCILGGATESNKGLRIRILQAQPKGVDGPIGGVFQILDAGDNKHAEFLAPLLGKTADAVSARHDSTGSSLLREHRKHQRVIRGRAAPCKEQRRPVPIGPDGPGWSPRNARVSLQPAEARRVE